MKRHLGVGAFALVLVAFLALFADGFSMVSRAEGQGKVTASSAKIRKEASSASEMVGSASQNQTITISSSVQGSDGYTWYQVTVDGVTGYIRSDLVSASGDITESATGVSTATVDVTAVNPVSATVTGGQSVRVRSDASTTSQIVTTVASGTALTITGQATGTDGKVWYQVNFISNGTTVEGFIRNDFVNLSEEPTPATEGETPAEGGEAAEPEATEEPEEQKAYETVLQDGDWYLVVTDTNEGYVIQDIFDSMKNNQEEYAKLEKKAKKEKTVIALLVVFLIAAVSGVIFLFMKLKDLEDTRYFNEVERETLRRRAPQGRQNVMPTVGEGRQGTRPAAGKPAGTNGGQSTKAAGQSAAQAKARAAAQGNDRQSAKAAGQSAAQAKERAAAQGNDRQSAKAAGQSAAQAKARTAGAQNGKKSAPQTAKGNAQPGWQAKNFLADDDDDEFEFEFLNYDGDGEQV